MKVYVVFRDVPFEFGEIYHICKTRSLAEKLLKEILEEYNNVEEFKILEFDVEE
jgi:hypothetical protein